MHRSSHPIRRPVPLSALLALLLAAGAALAQPGAERSVAYPVRDAGGSGVIGVVTIGDFGDAGTVVVVALQGAQPDGDHPSHFHAGDCGSGGGIVVPLANVSGATGLGVSWVDASYDDIVEGDHSLNVHLSADALGTIVACGEVGAGATPGAAPTDADDAISGDAATPVRPEEFEVPQVANYTVSPVDGSGVDGSVQLLREVDGPTSILVSLRGIDTSERYPLALYRGDCGPDRELVAELNPTGGNSVPDAPNASETILELEFEEVAEGDHFLYVFAPGEAIDRPADFGLDGRVVACGEIGAGGGS